MALTGDGFTGKSKIEAQNFELDSFTNAESQVFDDDSIISIMTQIKTKLGSISKKYDEISAGYQKCLTCTSSGKKMDTTKNTDGKKILKFQKKAAARADICSQKKTTLANEISTLKLVIDAINASNDAALDTADSSTPTAEES